MPYAATAQHQFYYPVAHHDDSQEHHPNEGEDPEDRKNNQVSCLMHDDLGREACDEDIMSSEMLQVQEADVDVE